MKVPAESGPRLGLDENGLGPRLGPMIVTATYAELSDRAPSRYFRRLPPALAADLDDSKAIVSCHDVSIAEAWSQVVFERSVGRLPEEPRELLEFLCPESSGALQQICPGSTEKQCWSTEGEEFNATPEQLSRVRQHVETLGRRGVELVRVRSEVVCTGRLNQLKEQGVHRFAADLHAMERLILALRAQAQRPVVAVCGKVGGIGKYEPFFGPLGAHLRTVLEEGQGRSSYHFPGVGALHFVRDADGADLLVMLASLVGKFLRELLMARVARFYSSVTGGAFPSGYHDPVTRRFVEETAAERTRLRIVQDCFERRPAK